MCLKKRLLAVCFCTGLLLFLSQGNAAGQRISVGTNLVEWLNFGTINAEASLAVGQHVSLHTGARYNNWTFRKGDPEARMVDPYGLNERQFENRKQSYHFGMRWWPWHIYSGWWFSLKGQYMEYNRGGLLRKEASEADAFGGGLGFGYAHMLSDHWNIEFGIAGWGGWERYTTYRCTNCGAVKEKGERVFVMPDDAFISLIYVF